MRTLRFKTQLLSFASATALAIAATPATAQDADTEDEVEEIIVTGIRASIMSSIAKKRNNSSIVEAISAEDLGKLPDVSIAEAIARLPGLAAQRLDGRANVISIRGLAPDFTTTTLNGREQVSANNNRAVEFDQYPSELIHGVTIYKTPDAGLTSQAVGGTVDLQTVRPLAYGKQTLAVSLRGEYNDLGALNSGTTATGYRGSISYVDQFADDTIGIALGYSRMSSPTQEERWNSWGYPDAAAGNLVIGGAKPYVKSNELIRDGFMGVFEYQPSADISTTVDAYYSKFDDTQILRGIEIPLAWSGAALQPGYTLDGDLVTAGQYNGVEVVVRNDVVQRDAETYAFGWNTEYKVNDSWTVEADISYSKVSRTESNMETYAGTGRGSGVGATDDLGFTMGEDGGSGVTFTHGLDYSDPNLIQLGGPLSWGWGLFVNGDYPSDNAQDGFINRPSTDDDLAAIKMSAEQTLNNDVISSIEYGVRWSERNKSLTDEGLYLTLKAYPSDLPVPAEYLLDPTSLAFIGMGDMLSYDAQALYDDGFYVESLQSASSVDRSKNSWSVKEKVFNAYVQANIDADWGDVPVTGNIGMQAIYTDQSSVGWLATLDTTPALNGDPHETVIRTQTEAGDSYWEFLPSMNLSFHVAEDQKLRVSVARILARPRMDQMNASSSIGYNSTLASSTDINNSPWGGGGGNPSLRPWMTWQFDVAYEKYFGEGGYVSVGAFYKNITSFPFDQSVLRDFSDFLPFVSPTPTLTEGLITAPENISGGKIYGLELSASVPFSMIAESLDGFGATFSASFTDSEIKETPESDPIVLPGLSKTVLNSTLYYEKNGFQARASVRHRSDFLGEVSGLSLVREQKFIKAETIFDAQVSYDLSNVGVDGLSVLFQVSNITNEPFTSYQGDDKRMVRDFQNYGRTYLFGLNWKM